MATKQANIVDIKITQNGRLYAKVAINGNLVGEKVPPQMAQKSIEAQEPILRDQIPYSLLKSSQDSPSSVKAAEGYSALIGGSDHRIVSSDKYGNFIVGPTTFTAHPENIRMGGVFRLNGLATSTMPSTIITPIPMFTFDYPLKDALKDASQILSDFQDFVKEMML